MSEEGLPGCAAVHRRIDEAHEAVLARADVLDLTAAYEAHARLWQLEPDPLVSVMMRQFLGAACLYLSSRPVDENVAWTLNLAKPPLNLFVTGESDQKRVTGRFFEENVREVEESRIYVDTRRSQGRDTRSVIDVEGLDILSIFEQFALRSDQADARYFEISDHDYLMVSSLPTDERAWIRELSRDDALAAWDAARPLDRRDFWFQCGCTRERVAGVVAQAWGADRDELFGGESSVTVVCPRCGRRWSLGPEDLDAPGPGADG